MFNDLLKNGITLIQGEVKEARAKVGYIKRFIQTIYDY